MRSLLGKNFKLPMIMSNHRVECPKTLSCGWHRDGGAIDATRLEFSAGVLLPPRHTERDGTDRIGAKLTLSPRQTPLHESLRQHPKGRENGGTGGLNFYHALQYLASRHPPPPAAASAICLNTTIGGRSHRNVTGLLIPLLTLCRCSSVPDVSVLEKWYDSIHVARLFQWLCGLGDDFEFKGGQSWPITAGSGYNTTEGLPPGLA